MSTHKPSTFSDNNAAYVSKSGNVSRAAHVTPSKTHSGVSKCDSMGVTNSTNKPSESGKANV